MEYAGRIIFEGLEERLVDLHTRIHTGRYRAQPARRTTIPKADGSSRSLSIWCLEDKIVQQSITTVLSAVYEEDLLGFSYGFRQGRGQHDALDALTVGICRRKVNWILDADIQSFFDRIDHDWMMRFMEHRKRRGQKTASPCAASPEEDKADSIWSVCDAHQTLTAAAPAPPNRRNGPVVATCVVRPPELFWCALQLRQRAVLLSPRWLVLVPILRAGAVSVIV